MKRYNRDKRATYKMHTRTTRTTRTHDTHDTHDTCDIHIPIKYDGYKRTTYMRVIHGKTRDTHARISVDMTNTINDIFPDINAPHNAHTYRANAPYHRYIPQETYHTRPEPEPDTIHKDTRTVKCIIMNDNEEIIYIGMMRRTRTVNVSRGTIDITLRRNDRTMQAYERAIDPNRIIHSMTVKDIKAHDVEIYYI